MMVEGVGKRAPAIVRVVMPSGAMRLLLSEAKRRAEFRGYRKQNSAWKAGLLPPVVLPNIGSVSQDVRPIFAGILGEEACIASLSKHLGKDFPADTDLRPGGDGGVDFAYCGLTLQIKTTQSIVGGNLVRVRNWRGSLVPFAAHACVFCEWTGLAAVGIRGWCWWRDVKSLPQVKARRGNHMNIEIPSNELRPWRSLCMEYQAREMK